jgi:VanZ family protein
MTFSSPARPPTTVSNRQGRGSLKPSLRTVVRNWWPVAVWLVVIRLESSEVASSTNTFGLLDRVSAAIFGRVEPNALLAVNTVLRKSGHFIGYAILSWLVFLALKRTHRDRLAPHLRRRWRIFFRDIWHFDWAVVAVLFTAISASFDEIHQTSLASRTGRWQDVALDTAGALLMQLLLYARALHTMNSQRRHAAEEHEISLIP